MQVADGPAPLQPEVHTPAGAHTEEFLPRLLPLVIFAALLLTHFSLLRLPYIWDEAGYYVPAARDLLLTGSLTPHSTLSNAHPPLVMAWLAIWWKIVGYAPWVTRSAMLIIATFTLTGVFQLARQVANEEVAIAAVICSALYPVFFAQSSLAHLDMAAAGFTIWGLCSYLRSRRWSAAVWFCLAVLAKETALLAPIALFGWEVAVPFGRQRRQPTPLDRHKITRSFYLLLPILPLGAWFAYHYLKTGYLFGNRDYFEYNVSSTLHPLRILLAFGTRLWQMFGYLNLWLLTAATILAMFLPAQPDSTFGKDRPRISFDVQRVFYLLIAAYVVALAVVGGALLARYLLPVYPLWIIVCVSTLWRRVRFWRAVVAIVCLGFIAALFVNPPYGFAFEDNLAYRDYIQLHEHAENFLEARYPAAAVLTAWPASDELTRPYLGYVSRPMRVVRIDNFSFEQMSAAADLRSQYDVALVFSTKYLPERSLLARWPAWERIQARYFGFHRDLTPLVAARVLGGEVIYSASHNGQWVAVIRMERIVDARVGVPRRRMHGGSAAPATAPLCRQEMAGVSFNDQPYRAAGLQVQ